MTRSIAGATKLTGKVSLSTIGYGNYYNEDFLSKLVAANGNTGIRRHINDITNFSTIIDSVRDASERTAPTDIQLAVSSGGQKAGLILRTTPEITKVGDNGQLVLQAITDEEATLFIALPVGSKDVTLTGTVNGAAFNQTVKCKPLSTESQMEAMLAAASWAFQTQDSVMAADLLQQTGNPVLATMASNAYSTREQLSIADDMRRILLDNNVRQRYSAKRYIGGGTSPCVVNLLRTLLEEDCTVFIPKNSYVKTTVTVIEEGMRHKPNAKLIAAAPYLNETS